VIGPAGATVRAIVRAEAPGNHPAGTADAVSRQTQPPHRVVIAEAGWAPDSESLGQETWVWLLDGGVLPEPEALERLLEVAADPGRLPAPALLASKVVLPGGSLDALSLPTARVRDPDDTVAAFERRLMLLRLAPRGSLLVRRSALVEVISRRPHLDPFADDLEWTARLLRDRPGLLVPASVAVREAGADGSCAALARPELARRGRLLLGGAIELRDKPWFAFRFLEEALRSGRHSYRNRPPWLRG